MLIERKLQRRVSRFMEGGWGREGEDHTGGREQEERGKRTRGE